MHSNTCRCLWNLEPNGSTDLFALIMNPSLLGMNGAEKQSKLNLRFTKYNQYMQTRMQIPHLSCGEHPTHHPHDDFVHQLGSSSNWSVIMSILCGALIIVFTSHVCRQVRNPGLGFGVLCYSIRLLTPPGVICEMSPCEHRTVYHWIADLDIPANNCSCDCFSHSDARACTCGTRTPPTIEDRRYGDAKRRRTKDLANHGTVKSRQR